MGFGWMELGPLRTQTIPKVWFFCYSAGTVFLLPFLTILYRSLGFNEELIGVLCALRPFVAAVSGSLVVSAADATQRHLAVLLIAYTAAFLGRSLMAFFAGFGAQLALALVTEAAGAPMGALIDAAIMASATDDGGYGRVRMWSSIGWGATAPIAGAVVSAYGLKAAFLCFTALVGIMALPTALLPMEALSKNKGRAGAAAAAEGTGLGGKGPRLSTCSDKLGGKGRGSSLGDDDEAALLSVRVSGASQAGEASGHGGKPAAPAPLQRTWTIGSNVAREGTGGEGAGLGRDAGAGAAGGRPVISLVADATGAGAAGIIPRVDAVGVYSEPPSPERPLLLYNSAPASPAMHARPAGTTSPLEIAPARAEGMAGAAGDVSVWQGVKGLLRDVHVLVFLLLALLMGIGNGAIGYLFLYLDELGATGTLMGLCLTFNCAAEAPVFFFSGPILQRIGVERALQVAMGAYVVRLCCYLALPLLPSPWCVLPVELLQGATFALAWAAGTVHVKHIAPPHLRGTVQSIFSGLYTGVGAGMGGLAGGLLYGSFGAAALFRTAAITLACGWAAANVVLRLWGGGGAHAPHEQVEVQARYEDVVGAVVDRRQAGCGGSDDGEEVALLSS